MGQLAQSATRHLLADFFYPVWEGKMGFFQLTASRSAWKTYSPGSPAWGTKPNPWQTPHTLVRLGSKAAPRLDGDGDPVDPKMVDWDWRELEDFAEQVGSSEGQDQDQAS